MDDRGYLEGESGMRMRVLGPIDALTDDGNVVEIRGKRPARLLALLAASPTAGVRVDRLIEQVWFGLDQPVDPDATLRTYVARLRSALGKDAIVTGTASYRLGDHVTTDCVEFETLVVSARSAITPVSRLELWQRALALWRGDAFGATADLEWIRPTAARLEELRAEAIEAWFDSRLASGEIRELAADLDLAVAEFPLREGLRAQQMSVLARSGRRVEALRTFQNFRTDLTEIGLEPSATLFEIDQKIARGENPVCLWGSKGGLPTAKTDLVDLMFSDGLERARRDGRRLLRRRAR